MDIDFALTEVKRRLTLPGRQRRERNYVCEVDGNEEILVEQSSIGTPFYVPVDGENKTRTFDFILYER